MHAELTDGSPVGNHLVSMCEEMRNDGQMLMDWMVTYDGRLLRLEEGLAILLERSTPAPVEEVHEEEEPHEEEGDHAEPDGDEVPEGDVVDVLPEHPDDHLDDVIEESHEQDRSPRANGPWRR